jgi:general secretion pathway protein C
MLWLPSEGIEYKEKIGGKSLYYRVKLTPNEASVPKPVHKKPVVIAGSIKDITLVAVYNSSDTTVVTIEYKRKSKILGRGDVVNGFTLVGGGSTYATFNKDNKTYQVDLQKAKKSSASNSSIRPASNRNRPTNVHKRSSAPAHVEGDVVDAGDHKIVDKALIDHYSKNLKEIYKNIGIGESKVNGKTKFKITFVKRGSPFAKLGVKRGDIINSLNGQEINSEADAFRILKDIDNIENITLGIVRGKKEMELEYEIN